MVSKKNKTKKLQKVSGNGIKNGDSTNKKSDVNRALKHADIYTDSHFVWSTKNIDLMAEWSFENICPQTLYTEILPKLQEFSKLKWGEILSQTHGKKNKSKHHIVSPDTLSPKAQVRFDTLDIDGLGIDHLFSLRLGNKKRIFGLRDNAVFRILWWDPEHKICPSHKK